METTRSFCRLCASITPNEHLRSLDSVRRESCELVAALQRIDLNIYRGDALPQTVCKPCVRRVKMLANFIREVEDAQVILTKIFTSEQAVKQERHTEHDALSEDRSMNESDVNEPVKEESFVKVKEELQIEVYDPPNDDIESLDVKSENDIKSSGKSSPAHILTPTTEMPIVKFNNTPSIEDSTTKIGKKYQEVNECENLPKKVESTQLANLKIIDSPNPLWSDYWCCYRCDKKCKTVYELRDHSIDAHGRCAIYKCSICPKRLIKFYGFLMHMKLHCELLERCCEYCNVIYGSKLEVKQHKKVEHASEKKKYRCVKCGLEFDFAVDLKCHRESFTLAIVMNPENRSYACDNCGKVFDVKSKLSIHMMIHYPNRYHCKICNSYFRQKSTLVQHASIVHGPRNKYICQICGKTFKSSSNLKGHVDVHMGVKPHSCDICEKTFRTSVQMRNHRLSHGGSLLHTCQICGKSFRHKSCLHQHKNIHAAVKPYSCKICPKDFSSWPNFNKHMKRIHGKNMAKEKVKKDVGI